MKKIFLFFSLLFLVSCGISWSEQTIKIPVLAAINWDSATYWEDAVNAYSIAVEEINNKWWINWVKVELIVENSWCNWKDWVSGAQKLINIDNAQVIVWALCSSATIPSGKLSQKNKIPQISPISSADKVAHIWEYIRRYWNDANITSIVSNFLVKKWYTNIAIIVENTDYWVWYTEWVKANKKLNVVFEEKYNQGEKDFSIIAKKIKSKINEIDVLVVIPNSDAGILWNMKALEKEWILEDLKWRIIGTELIFIDSVISGLWDKLEWIYTTTLPDIENLDKKAKKFVDKFKSKYDIKTSELFIMLEAEAMYLTLDAVKAVWYDKAKIHKYLLWITKDNKRKGLFGEYYFDWSEAIWLNFVVKQWKNWKTKAVKY